MNILSLFDGMSCGQIALNRAGIRNYTYYAGEIDKHAIKVTQNNYPNTIQLGSVINIKGGQLPQIDLLIGGSPCQGFSAQNRERLYWTNIPNVGQPIDKGVKRWLKISKYRYKINYVLSNIRNTYFFLEK